LFLGVYEPSLQQSTATAFQTFGPHCCGKRPCRVLYNLRTFDQERKQKTDQKLKINKLYGPSTCCRLVTSCFATFLFFYYEFILYSKNTAMAGRKVTTRSTEMEKLQHRSRTLHAKLLPY